MKVYRGRRTDAGGVVTVEDESGRRPLSPRYDLRRHSPAGFEWGYGGSGTTQLALAGNAWTLNESEVMTAITNVERPQAKTAARLAAQRDEQHMSR